MFDLAVPHAGQQEMPASIAAVEIENLAVTFAWRVIAKAARAEPSTVSAFSTVVLGSAVWVQADLNSAVVRRRGDGRSIPPLGDGMDSCILIMNEEVLRALLTGEQSMTVAIDSGRVIVDGDEAQVQAMYVALRIAFP